MSKIKNFESFINEELKPETYKSAADKLKEKGHKSRAERIEKHSKEQIKNVKPVTLEMYGEEYHLDSRSIFDIDENFDKKGSLMFCVDFKGSGLDYENKTDEEIEDMEMESMVTYFNFYIDTKSPMTKYDVSIDGATIPDRRNALKLLKFIKEYFSYYGGPIEQEVNKLTVNDLYEE